jgi:methyl-accepting chemotaxis protein
MRESFRHSRLRKVRVTGILILSICLAGCSSAKDRQARALNLLGDISETASGIITDTTEGVQAVVGGAKETMEDVKDAVEEVKEKVDEVGERIDKVQEGVDKLKEGKDLIEEGVGG